jgi:hypothetical protein
LREGEALRVPARAEKARKNSALLRRDRIAAASEPCNAAQHAVPASTRAVHLAQQREAATSSRN